MPEWSQIFFEHGDGKAYKPFQKWLVETNYFKERRARLTIKAISNFAKSNTTKVNKWL